MAKFITKGFGVIFWVSADLIFKLRYQGSLIGYASYLLKPLLLFIILYVVFVFTFWRSVKTSSTTLYIFTWYCDVEFFYRNDGSELGSIVGRGDLIRKISIPRSIMIVFDQHVGNN